MAVVGTTRPGGSSSFGSLSASLITSANATYDVGSSSYKWRDAYFSRNVTIGGTLGVTGITTVGDKIVSDTNNTDDLGSSGVRWANVYSTLLNVSGAATFGAGATFSGAVSGITTLAMTGALSGGTTISCSGAITTTANAASAFSASGVNCTMVLASGSMGAIGSSTYTGNGTVQGYISTNNANTLVLGSILSHSSTGIAVKIHNSCASATPDDEHRILSVGFSNGSSSHTELFNVKAGAMKIPTRTIATLDPASAHTGCLVYVSDANQALNSRLCYSDGTNWISTSSYAAVV